MAGAYEDFEGRVARERDSAGSKRARGGTRTLLASGHLQVSPPRRSSEHYRASAARPYAWCSTSCATEPKPGLGSEGSTELPLQAPLLACRGGVSSCRRMRVSARVQAAPRLCRMPSPSKSIQPATTPRTGLSAMLIRRVSRSSSRGARSAVGFSCAGRERSIRPSTGRTALPAASSPGGGRDELGAVGLGPAGEAACRAARDCSDVASRLGVERFQGGAELFDDSVRHSSGMP